MLEGRAETRNLYFVSPGDPVIFFLILYYITTFLAIFRRFSTNFAKNFEESKTKFVRRLDERFRAFKKTSEDLRKLLKIAEDC